MCVFWDQGICRHGLECWFAHGKQELELGVASRFDEERAKAPATARIDFSSTMHTAPSEVYSRTINIPLEQVDLVMTHRARDLLMDVGGATDVRWDKESGKATVYGTTVQQVGKASGALQRVSTHCLWGINEAKVLGLLHPKTDYTAARCRLSPMMPSLKALEVVLSATRQTLTIGTDPSSGLVVKGPHVSRAHATLEFQPAKGAVYVIDTSTNGTFVNGKRLPAKGSGKVVLWHGDDMLLQDPNAGCAEFGFVINIEFT
jgi:hypothetical protein